MITLNAPTSYAYVLLRKTAHHYAALRERMEEGDRVAILSQYVGMINREGRYNSRHKPMQRDTFPDEGRIDFDMIAQVWDVNLPMNDPTRLAEMGVRAERYGYDGKLVGMAKAEEKGTKGLGKLTAMILATHF